MVPRAECDGRWEFAEGQAAHCRDCGTFLAHSWSYVVGSRTDLSLCTACVARYIAPV
jgi:hypothetical protein